MADNNHLQIPHIVHHHAHHNQHNVNIHNNVIENIIQSNLTKQHKHFRKTKIVATIGPASNSPEVFKQMMEAGLNCARLNFSHGSYETHEQNVKMMRQVCAENGYSLCILQDLQGPKIRIGKLEKDEPVFLKAGDKIDIVTDSKFIGNKSKVGTTYKSLCFDAIVGNTILIDDGLLQLKVLEKRLLDPSKASKGDEITCEVLVGGKLSNSKGINLPGTALSAPALTDKDIEDLEFGLTKIGVDMICLSFVRSAADIEQARALMSKFSDGKKVVPIVSKIERIEALQHYDEILNATDAVMIARGDLGVELNYWDLPLLQKQLIAKSSAAGKLNITATQMLASMVDNPMPTRAETCDIANAIFDGTDAVMLSNESAVGKYPVKAIEVMANVAANADSAYHNFGLVDPEQNDLDELIHTSSSTSGSLTNVACMAAASLSKRYQKIKCIAVVTNSGKTAWKLSMFKPTQPIIALTSTQEAYNRLALCRGVTPIMVAHEAINCHDGHDVQALICKELKKKHVVANGDFVVMVLGQKTVTNASNTVRIITVQDEVPVTPNA